MKNNSVICENNNCIEAVKIIKSKNLSMKKLNIIVIAIMGQVNELSYEEMEKRFQNK